MRSSLLLLVVGAAACIAERGPLTNRMAHSATNYLARAARQPVKWQPWGRDAFVLAARLDRPVLLYVGGEACRWCAETDRAIYTNPEIGTLKPGSPGDATIIAIEDGNFIYRDVLGEELPGKQRMVSRGLVLGGKFHAGAER